jgi:hypothetical protein
MDTYNGKQAVGVVVDYLEIDAAFDGEEVTLNAKKVGQILQITPIGDSRHLLLHLLFLASNFPTPRMRQGAAPPNRRQHVEYPTLQVVVSKIVKWFSGTALLSKLFAFTENNLNKGTGAYAIGMENAFQACYKWQKDELLFYPILGPDALQESSPFQDCYLRHSWDLLV